MDTLLGSATEDRQRVEVVHLHAYAPTHASRLKRLAIADERTINELVRQARRDLDPAITNDFLRAEWDAVIDYWGIRSFDEYKAIPRTGRDTPIAASLRRQLWDVFEQVQRQLATKELYIFGQI
jgi:hypothetical protein